MQTITARHSGTLTKKHESLNSTHAPQKAISIIARYIMDYVGQLKGGVFFIISFSWVAYSFFCSVKYKKKGQESKIISLTLACSSSWTSHTVIIKKNVHAIRFLRKDANVCSEYGTILPVLFNQRLTRPRIYIETSVSFTTSVCKFLAL